MLISSGETSASSVISSEAVWELKRCTAPYVAPLRAQTLAVKGACHVREGRPLNDALEASGALRRPIAKTKAGVTDTVRKLPANLDADGATTELGTLATGRITVIATSVLVRSIGWPPDIGGLAMPKPAAARLGRGDRPAAFAKDAPRRVAASTSPSCSAPAS